jgi:hypothetical protein
MAIGILFEGSGWTRETYQEMNRQMFGSPRPSSSIDGIIIHTAGEGPNGFRIVDVWESQEHFQRFMEEKVMPAAQEIGAPQGPDPQIWELDNVLIGEGAGVRS